MSTDRPPRCDRTVAWASLAGHFEAHGRELDLRDAFARDPGRVAALSWQAAGVRVDASKGHWDLATLRWLLQLADECKLAERRDAMLSGAVVNETEGRRVLHTVLRSGEAQAGTSQARAAQALVEERASVTKQRIKIVEIEALARARGIKHVVNIGIGGSDLGPQLVVQALAAADAQLRVHFASNIDPQDLLQQLEPLLPEETMFVVSSKTFTTQETLANLRLARAWFDARGGSDVAEHFVAVTANPQAAREAGIEQCLEFWDWVGGRFSLWSSIGLPIALALGLGRFEELLDGARAMDEHFATASLECNLPVLLGLMDLWYRNFHRYASRCIVPYAHGLRRLPAYLQQLMMESNGKSVDMDGHALPYATSDVVWGEPGTNAQHAFFQMLHQGSDIVPVEFLLVRHANIDTRWSPAIQAAAREQHRALLANALAQAQALMAGRSAQEVLPDCTVSAAAAGIDPRVLARHRSFAGNRPSLTLMIERLDAYHLGALIALYEHRVFVSGALWGINSFDQWGVELGKSMGKDVLARLHSGVTQGLDASTAAWVQQLK